MFPASDYQELTVGCGMVELRGWTQIELTGADRLKFLNSFCTADLRKLSPDHATEAFVCNVKGKVLGHVFVLCGNEVLVMETVPGQADVLIPHLDRYTLSDDVALRDVSRDFSLLAVAGAKSPAILARLSGQPLPHAPLKFAQFQLGDVPCSITRHYLLGEPTFTLRAASGEAERLSQRLTQAGAVLCGAEAFEACRIEAGMPLYGRDITAENLPQEINRNAQAISFTKGCYLGQETVARIDALGHVNRLLVGVQFLGEQIPAAGELLMFDGKPVGHVTSATFSPRLGRPLALAYIRSEHAQPGQKLTSATAEAVVHNGWTSERL